MPAVYYIPALSPAAAYAGTLFEDADAAPLLAARIAFEQAPTASKSTPGRLSCRLDDVEVKILPYISSRSDSSFEPVWISAIQRPMPGALLVARYRGAQLHIRHGGRLVIDSRTLNSTISSAHIVNGVHRSLARTLSTLNANFSLVPIDYVTTVLSHCSSCAHVNQSPLQDLSNLDPTLDCLPDPKHHSLISTPTLPTEEIIISKSSRKRPSSPSSDIRASVRRRTHDKNSKKADINSPLCTTTLSPACNTSSSSPSSYLSLLSSSPLPKAAKTDLECAGVTDEIAEMMYDDEELDNHEDFLLRMHAIYEKAGLPADRLIGNREDLEVAASGEDYYYGLSYEF